MLSLAVLESLAPPITCSLIARPPSTTFTDFFVNKEGVRSALANHKMAVTEKNETLKYPKEATGRVNTSYTAVYLCC